MVHVPPYGERVGHGSAHLVARSAKMFYYVASLEISFTTNEFSCVWQKNSIGRKMLQGDALEFSRK